MVVDGEPQWVSYADLEADDCDFARIGDDFRRPATRHVLRWTQESAA